jgi:uncharacterized RDD family membrane protein YckC
MKKISTTVCLVLLTTVFNLLPVPPIAAQETNVASPSPDPSAADATNSPASATAPAAVVVPETNAAAPAAPQSGFSIGVGGRKGAHHQPIVLMGQNAELKAGDSAEAVVVIGGSAKVHGSVREAAVVILGDLEVDGEVGDAVVAVMGNIHLKPGARVRRDAVAVMGTITAAPDVSVGGDAVSVGGKLDISDDATVKGERVCVGLPFVFPNAEWLRNWFKYCVFQCRPLAPQVGWVWVVAGIFFLVYLLVAVLLPQPVRACVDHLTRRPATTFLLGMLTKLLVPVIFMILAFTGIGIVVIPFLVAALFFGAILGKVAMLEWIGLQVGRPLGGVWGKSLMAFLIGTVIVTLLYMVPIIGLVVYTLLSMWGIGCVVAAAFGSMRREMPEKPPVPTPGAGGPPVGLTAAAPVQNMNPAAPVSGFDPSWPAGSTMSSIPGAAAVGAVPGPGAAPLSPPAYPPALMLPRAGFWDRMGAAFLDVVFVGILSALVGGMPLGLVVALAYFAGMWTWKGTTIGGIVLRLQVVRSDGAPLTFVVALVRALACTFSMIVFFLGFLWIAWDADKQAWHDKIAGTLVVRVPRSLPLVCV